MGENKSRVELARKVIREQIKVSDVFKEYGRFVDPVWRGEGQYKICCPFHNDKRPSLGIDDKTGQWNCFGCDCKGDAVTALMHLARLVDHVSYSYGEAIDQLIVRTPRLKESLQFDTVIDKTVVSETLMQRPKIKFTETQDIASVSMTDVYNLMNEIGKTSFIDVAYASSMMMNRQEPTEIIAFFRGDSQPVQEEQTAISAAELLDDFEDDDW